MYWCVIHIKQERCQEFIDYFNRQEDVHAFLPKIERWFSNSEKKEYQKVSLYPDYIFVKTTLSKELFHKQYKDVFQILSRYINLMEYDNYVSLKPEEQYVLERLLNGGDIIQHSIGNIVNSQLKIEQGPLVGMEDQIQKINRHKRIAYLHCDMFGKAMKVPLEVVTKS